MRFALFISILVQWHNCGEFVNPAASMHPLSPSHPITSSQCSSQTELNSMTTMRRREYGLWNSITLYHVIYAVWVCQYSIMMLVLMYSPSHVVMPSQSESVRDLNDFHGKCQRWWADPRQQWGRGGERTSFAFHAAAGNAYEINNNNLNQFFSLYSLSFISSFIHISNCKLLYNLILILLNGNYTFIFA